MKKIYKIFILAFFLMNFQIYANANEIKSIKYSDVNVVFNAKELDLLKPLISVNENTNTSYSTLFIPIRDLLEALGHKVEWDDKSKSINISGTVSDNIPRKVTKLNDSITKWFFNYDKIYIDGNEFNANIITVIGKNNQNDATNYIALYEILEYLGYIVEEDRELNTIFISKNNKEISISSRGLKINYTDTKPYRDGAFIYLPLEQTILSLNHGVTYNYYNGKIKEAVLNVRNNKITIPINSNEIIIEPPIINSNYKILGIQDSLELPIKDNKIVSLVGTKNKGNVFKSYRKTVLDENNIVYVELSLINEIFEVETNNHNFNINIIDFLVKNFEIEEIKCQPNLPYEIYWELRNGSYIDSTNGEVIKNENMFEFIRKKDFRTKDVSNKNINLAMEYIKKNYWTMPTGIYGYTKNGYPIAGGGREDYFWILTETSIGQTGYYIYYNIFHPLDMPD